MMIRSGKVIFFSFAASSRFEILRSDLVCSLPFRTLGFLGRAGGVDLLYYDSGQDVSVPMSKI
jgi:hypothetical protein